MSRRVLVVEDEPSIAETIWYALRTEGFEVADAATGGEALAKLATETFDCVILDVGLPDMSGFDVCRTLRQTTAVPILFLTARDGEIDRIVGLELGADDYVPKPFSPRELAARVRAILRRTHGTPQAAPLTSKPAPASTLDHDPIRKLIRCGGQPLDLSRNEYHLLLALMKNPGRVLTRDQLMDAAKHRLAGGFDRAIDVQVSRLRRKIDGGDEGQAMIKTVRGAGYLFAPAVSRA